MSITPKDRALVSLPLLLLACAGSSDVVDLGGGSMTQSGTGSGRCAESTTFSGNVFVTQQSDLDQLAGCEEITGDLNVAMFSDASLLPLRSLRKVGGILELGSDPTAWPTSVEIDLEEYQLERARLDALQEQGWLESLEGLEALESVGGLVIAYILAPDLRALGQLASIGSLDAGTRRGAFIMSRTKNIKDLSGLERAANIGWLSLSGNQLESLDGLQVGETLETVSIGDNATLHDIDALAPVRTILGDLSLNATALENLEALEVLEGVADGVTLTNNPKLVDVSRLAQLRSASSIQIRDNDALRSLPSFERIQRLESLHILDNAALEEVYLDSDQHWAGQFHEISSEDEPWGEGHHLPGVRIEIQRNEALQRVTSVGGFTEVMYVTIEDNPALTDLDLTSIERVDYLSVNRNATLAHLSVPVLRTVDSLEVMDNPVLSVSAFANVKTFERVMSGNAAEP